MAYINGDNDTCPKCLNDDPSTLNITNEWDNKDIHGIEIHCEKCTTEYTVKYNMKFISNEIIFRP